MAALKFSGKVKFASTVQDPIFRPEMRRKLPDMSMFKIVGLDAHCTIQAFGLPCAAGSFPLHPDDQTDYPRRSFSSLGPERDVMCSNSEVLFLWAFSSQQSVDHASGC